MKLTIKERLILTLIGLVLCLLAGILWYFILGIYPLRQCVGWVTGVFISLWVIDIILDKFR